MRKRRAERDEVRVYKKRGRSKRNSNEAGGKRKDTGGGWMWRKGKGYYEFEKDGRGGLLCTLRNSKQNAL